jgi:hypothetical protein
MYDQFGLARLPLIPPEILRRHRVYEPSDTRFRASARLLQALWREDRQLPIGSHINRDGSTRKLGSRISIAAGRAGANFLSPEVAYHVRREVAYRELGALIDEHRLWTNLLSSMPLCFNLLGPMALDLRLATRVLHLVCPDLEKAIVRAIWFEHSPGRGVPSLTSDGTAFDAFLTYETGHGRTGFVAVEVKYTETGHEPAPTLRPRYDKIAQTSRLFTDPVSRILRVNPLQQLFREHCLAQAMLMRKDYDEGRLVVIAPRLNHLTQNSVSAYQGQLQEPSPGQVGFQNICLEQVIEAIAAAGLEEYARALYRRYCDWWLVDGEIELALAEAQPLEASDADVQTHGLKLIAGGRT